jgi:hypothetical protein
LASVIRWASGKALVALLIYKDSRGVTVEATACLEAVLKVSRSIVLNLY